MKVMIFFFLSLQILAFDPFQSPGKVDLGDWVDRKETLPDEIWLKERLKLEDPNIIKGEIRGHKVGNGFSLPNPNNKLEMIKKCSLGSAGNFIFLQDQQGGKLAVITEKPDQENLAEFLEIKDDERTVGMKTYSFTSGHNPLRGEMFQIEWLKEQRGLLRLVMDNQLNFYLIDCHR